MTTRANFGERIIRSAAIAAIACGLTAFGAALVDEAVWRSLAERIRRREDATVERTARLRQCLVILGLQWTTAGAGAWVRRRAVREWFGELWSETRTFPPALAAKLRASAGIVAAAGFILAIGAGYRLWYLNVPVDYDEAYTFLNFARRSALEAISDYNTTNNHLLNTFCMHWSYRLFGQHEWALRLPVLMAGIATVALAGLWSGRRLGAGVGLASMTLAAVSPLLVYYSTNARGYMFLTAATLTFDICIAHRLEGGRFSRLAGALAVAAAALGLWAMPNAVYALAATLLWTLPAAWRTGGKRRALSILFPAIAGGVIAATLYLPAYVFRGTQAFDHPFVRPLPVDDWLVQMPTACGKAAASWCQGPIAFDRPWLHGPGTERTDGRTLALASSLWFGLFAMGAWSAFRERKRFAWLLAWPAATLILMSLQRVAPPIRVFLFLAPWFYAVVALGWMRLSASSRLPSAFQWATLGGLLVVHAGYFRQAPVAYDPHERSVVLSAPDVAEWIAAQDRQRGLKSSKAIVPLPCDVPLLFYAARLGLSLEVNAMAKSDGNEWLLTAFDDEPTATLVSPAVVDNSSAAVRAEWRAVQWSRRAEFPTLAIWSAPPIVQD